MSLFRVIRILITTLLVMLLLVVGSSALFVFTIDKVILTSSYFGEELLYSGTYSHLFEYVIDNYVSVESTDDMAEKANNPVSVNIMHSIKPTVFSNIAAEYLSGWMDYLLGDVPDNKIPLLNVASHRNSIYAAAVAALEDEDFVLALLEQHTQTSGLTSEELEIMIEDLNIKEDYMESINTALDEQSSLFYQSALAQDPLALLKHAAPDMSEDELLAKVKSYHGMLTYYKSIIGLSFAGILACIGIIFIMWVNRMSVPLILNGMVAVVAGVPLFAISSNQSVFNRIVLFFSKYVPPSFPDITKIDFFNNMAIRPIIDYMLVVSGITISIGLLFILAGILIRKEKPPKIIVPKSGI